MANLKVRNVTLGAGKPKVCVSLVATNFEELFAEALRLSKLDCDMIEWRADYFMYVGDLSFMRKAVYFIRYAIEDKPLIFTFRTQSEGGNQPIAESYYFELYEYMILTGLIDIIDIELNRLPLMEKNVISFAKAKNVKVLVSNHNYQETPSIPEMTSILGDMDNVGADILKLAVQPQNMSDVLSILDVSNTLQEAKPELPFIMIGMGEVGKLTRMTGEWFGSVITYASNNRYQSDLGQLPIHQVKKGMDIIGK